MEIFFDGVFINTDNYMSYEESFKSFESNFYLGSVASLRAKLQIPLKLITDVEGVYNDYSTPSIVSITTRIHNDDYNSREATFIVDKEEINEDNTVTLSLIDKLAITSTPIDISSLITYHKEYNPDTDEWEETGTGVSAKDLLAYICNYYGIPYNYSAFTNENVMIYSYDNTLTGRDYLSMIAELAGGRIYLDRYGYLKINNYNLNNLHVSYNTIDVENVDEYKLGNLITIERVVYDNGVGTFFESSSDTTLNTLYLSTNNLFLQTMTQTIFDNICTKIIGFNYHNVEIPTLNTFLHPANYDSINGNRMFLHTLEDEYVPIIYDFEKNYLGGFVGSVKTSFNSQVQEESEFISNEEKINSIKTIINQQEGSLEILAGKTTKLRVDVDKIEGYFELTPGNNLIHNSAFLLTDDVWTFNERTGGSHTNLGEGYNGSLIGVTQSLGEIKLSNCDAITTSENITDLIVGNKYILSFYLTNETNSSFNITLTGGNTEVVSDTINTEENMKLYSYIFTAITSSMTLKLSNTSGTSIIYDLLLLPGENVKEWETAKGELYSTTLTMSRQGLKVFSTGSNTLTFMTADGFQIREAHLDVNNKLVIGEIITKFDEYGTSTKDLYTTRIINSNKIVSTIVNVNGTDHYLEYWIE